MWVAELACAHGHGFEGWFGSRDDFEQQQSRGLVSCPQCGSADVGRRLSAPRLNFGAAAPKEAPPAPQEAAKPASNPADLIREVLAHLRAHAEDVGTRFAEEARRIHADEAPARAIRGRASADEFQALQDDGIEVWTLPALDLDHGAH